MRGSTYGFVLDASVTLAWAFKEEMNSYTRSVLRALEGRAALVPSLWLLEVPNALLVAERRKRISLPEVKQFLSFLGELPIGVEEGNGRGWAFGELLLLAREQSITIYDATYLYLALRYALPMATQDNALKAASIRCGVEIFGR